MNPTSNTDRVSNSASTGGAGTFFEQHVNAYWLALLLVRAVPPILRDCTVDEVHMQTEHLGWHTDDFLVVGKNRSGQLRKLAGQVKQTFTVSATNRECKKAIQDFWRDFKNPQQFSPESDQFVLVTLRGTNTLLSYFSGLLDCARASYDETDFEHRLNTPGFIDKRAVRYCKEIQKIVSEAEGRDVSLAEVWSFLRVLHVLSLDLNTSTAQAEAMIKTLLANTVHDQTANGTPDTSWNALLREASKGMSEARSYQRCNLPEELIQRHCPIADTEQRALLALNEVTEQYLKVTRRKLIRGSLIPRTSTQQLLDKINENDTNGADCVLTGKAGGGKTGCVIECVESLRQSNNTTVLAFRLDRIKPVSTTKELGKCLGLAKSPALVLKTAAEALSQDAVLVIDQLDAVSTTSGRSAEFFEVVEDLLDEVQDLRNSVKIHIVVVCRKFDWENDHRLRRPLGKDCVEVPVINFLMKEVKSVLQDGGFKAELFATRQLELLRLPQNLSLFLETNYGSGSRPTFFTQKDLFDRYWEEKRQAVKNRINPPSDHWMDVIQMLCKTMTESQQLSVSRETLDEFPPDYRNSMVSEGVLSFDQNRYSFGHEAFFDYCFARVFMRKQESLTEFLKKSEQHLFRRAQVRQVLIYLRDADPERYCKELRALLTDEKIRYHLKDLAVAVAVNMPNPEEAEWNVLKPWIESEIEAIKTGIPNTDKFASLVWRSFFFSQPWFQIVDKKGLVAKWLSSDKDALVDMGASYVRFHQRYSGDRVADLLKPFVGKGGDWPQRFKSVMQSANLANSRRFFELFLGLIDDGTFDDDSKDNTFRYNLHSLEDKHADWISEALSHWLLRRLSIIQETASGRGSPNWRGLFNHSDYRSVYISKAATQAPDKFVQHVLPVILKISDAAVVPDRNALPKLDAVWRLFFFGDVSIAEAYREAVALALGKIAESKSDRVVEILADLRSRETYLANFLLLRAYTAGAKYLADDAVSELCNKTWRFECGYSGSYHWVAIQLIEAATPFCSDENRTKLEEAILNYTTDYERSPGGHRDRGYACFALLSGIPAELRSERAKARYAELERKFGKTDFAPRGSQGGEVVSPIEETAAKKMTDDQWLKAIKRYHSRREIFWEDPTKGGARELARSLQGRVQEEPERFAHLSLRFPADTNPVYMTHILRGLKETEASLELKLKVCRKAYSEPRTKCGKEIADLLGSIKDSLPDDAVEMLNWLATEHPDPEKELWDEEVTGDTPYYGRDVLDRGINTTRGRAALAIHDLISSDASYIDRFCKTIEKLLNDRSLSVRSCAIYTLLPIINHDPNFALEQFLKLTEFQDNLYDSLLATPYVDHFIWYMLRDHFGQLRHVVERMLRSKDPETSKAGARLASLAVLYEHDDAEELVEEALRGDASQRLGVAQVASKNIGDTDYRSWAEQKLLLFFNDRDSEVCQEAAKCFGRLEGQSLESYEDLINKFCDSAACQTDSFFLLHALEESSHQLPGITYIVCEKFLKRFSGDARTGALDLDITIPKLVFRTYHQHQDDEWAPKCLDLIDQMCLERMYEIREELDEYER
ncbi:MAG: hypothetical protein F4W91_17220 [Gemmatimonadetes bacterium]|nr:hypothetical protein [Gemmatimonadota bacterium]